MENEVKETLVELKDKAVPQGGSIEISNGGSTKTTALIVKEELKEDSLSLADFHNNDNKILSVLNEIGSNYSFKGLMRKLASAKSIKSFT